MIEFTIEVPTATMQSMSPKMVMGNYINCDPRVRKVECDRMMGYCEVETRVELDIQREISYYHIRAVYKDLEAEMITRLCL